VVRVKPYFDKNYVKPRIAVEALAKRVYLMNVPYDSTFKELENFVSKFAPVDKVDIIRDK